ncbi:hypothetical protein ACFSTE_06225 [Aquimarina hainanensis]|uniref:EF-hand domain-containing protein n=1 Tax=Aquimarina hainanensis TaxID=1578017 RepID=A0ABW5N471_9FLAO|nr:hypothetical protein [Aquimarina sp. TRL1]QKX04799.1 hypothetical protein HN014_07680 [Aquimarina sp. TRL1]
MNRILYVITLILISQIIYAQNNKTLSKKLWTQAQSCYSMLEDMDGDGNVDYDEIIDDSKNGYLKISGSFPTCGCNCENTIGAYKTSKNKYIFIKEYSWSCSWKKGISLSDSVNKIFPFDFEAEGFFQKKIDNPNHIAAFYLDFEIPRKGTDTKVMIQLIPLGLRVESERNIEFSYTEENRFSYSDNLAEIQRIASQIKNNKTITHLLNRDFDNITEEDRKIIREAIGKNDNRFESRETLIKCLQELKQIYDLYTQIKYEWLILGWDRNNGKFYIKEKGKRTESHSFIAFLKNSPIWNAVC